MDNLFEALLALPEIDTYEWEICLFLLSDIRKKTALKFSHELNKKEFIDLKKSLKDEGLSIKNFLTARETIGSLCRTWYMILSIAWFQETKKEMSADDALPLIIEFLPHDPEQLEKLNASLTNIRRIEEKEDCAFYFLLFQSAIMIKLDPKKSSNNAWISAEEMDKILNAYKRINNESDLNTLRFNVVYYLAFLAKKISSLLSSAHYNAKRSETKSKNYSIYDILLRIKIGECSFFSSDKTIIYEIEKYFCLLNIKKYLFRECETKVILDKFNEFYHLYIDVKNASLSHGLQPFFLNKKFLTIPNIHAMLSTRERDFLAKASECVVEKKKVEDPDLSVFITLADNYAEEIECKIRDLIKQSYYYKEGNIAEGDFFNELLHDIQTNSISILFLNKEILILVEKYFILNDIQYSLARKKPDEFYQKLVQHFDFLNTRIDTYNAPQFSFFSHFGLSNFNYFSSLQKKEEEALEQDFMNAANKVMGKTADIKALFFGKNCA